MPYKTKYGSHYHMEEGCHGATIPCDANGLEPCSDCCGTKGGGGSTGGNPEAGGGIGSHAASATGTAVDAGHAGQPDACGLSNSPETSPIAHAMALSTAGAQAMEPSMPEPDGLDKEEIVTRIADFRDTASESGSATKVPMSVEQQVAGMDVSDATTRQIRQGVGYRSDFLFGEGHTEAPAVLAHETFTMGNTDIIDMLADGILRGTEVGERLRHISAVISGKESDPGLETFLDRAAHDDCDPEAEALFRDEVLPAVSETTGYDVRHVQWLCDSPDQVMDSYGYLGDAAEEDIDEHPVGGVLLSDLGEDGALWGYAEPLERRDTSWW